MNEKKEGISSEERRKLIYKQIEDFSKVIESGDSSSALLKGHLLVEHYLDHIMILIFDKKANVQKKSFYIKVSELKQTKCFHEHETTIACLFALNKVRNEMAHQLDFKITRSQIDSIGYFLGKEYILKRYNPEYDERKLLLWVLDEVVFLVYFTIYWKITSSSEKKVSSVSTQTQLPNLAVNNPEVKSN